MWNYISLGEAPLWFDDLKYLRIEFLKLLSEKAICLVLIDFDEIMVVSYDFI